jgi:hypothetical protein
LEVIFHAYKCKPKGRKRGILSVVIEGLERSIRKEKVRP